MLRGLDLLSDSEFSELGKLLKIDVTSAKKRTGRVLAWMAGVVNTNHADAAGIERAVLEWVAQRWSISFQETIDTNDLERLIRRRIATEATEFLSPAWRIACALTVEDSSAVTGLKFEMLTKSAEQVVPSQSVLEEHRQEWKRLCSTWSRRDPRPDLDGDLKTLGNYPSLGQQALKLGLVIALADGQLSADEERLAAYIGKAVELPEEDAKELSFNLHLRFCEHRNRLSREKGLGPVRSSIEAAEQTLAESGTVIDLAKEAREGVLQDLEPSSETKPEVAPQGWSRLLGALSGIAQFFSSRNDAEDHSNLVRIVYLTIQKQRAEVVGQGTNQ